MEQKEQKELKTMTCGECGQIFTGDGCRKSWLRHQRNTHKIDLKVSKGPNSQILEYTQPLDKQRIEKLEIEVKQLKETILQLQNYILGKELKAPIDPIQLEVSSESINSISTEETVSTVSTVEKPKPISQKPETKKPINSVGTVSTISTKGTDKPKLEFKNWDDEEEHGVVLANHKTKEMYQTMFRTTEINGKLTILCYLWLESQQKNYTLGKYHFDPDSPKACSLDLSSKFMRPWLDKMKKPNDMTICLLEDDVLFLTLPRDDDETAPGWQLAYRKDTEDYTILEV